MFTDFKKTYHLFIPNILKDLKSRYCAFAAITVVILDIIVASLLLPYFSKEVAQAFSLSLPASIGMAIIIFGILWTLEKTLGHLLDIIFFPAINHNIQSTTYRVIEKIHKLPLTTYQNISVPETMNAIRRISISARAFIKIVFLLMIPVIIKVFIVLQASLQYGAIGFILIPTFLLCMGILYKGTREYVKTRENSWHLSDKVIMRIHDSILNTSITRFHLNTEMASVGELLKQEAKLWYKTNTRLHLIHVLIALVLGLTFTLILYRIFQGVMEKNLSVGDFLALKTQLIAAFLPLKQLSIEFRQLAEASIDIKKIIHILTLPEEDYSASALFQTNSTKNSISKLKNRNQPFNDQGLKGIKGLSGHNVSFAYPDQSYILEGQSFHFVPGEKVVILGENGSGKSSFLRLLTGLIAPNQGKIRLHNEIIQNYPRNSLSKLLHYIPQDLRLFNLSLRENISYGMPLCPDSVILNALEMLDLSPLLAQLPQGLDSLVGELGSLLSGGEIQRIALARALIREPEILILDETLHSLNIEGERKVLETLSPIIPTIILVSHRPSTLLLADKAYRIANAKISEISKVKMNSDVQGIVI